jgi:cytochrome P450
MLAIHPEIQDMVYKEIHEQYPTDDVPLTLEILNALPYLDRVIKETLRRVPIIPLIAREVIEDFDLGPCKVKPGMIIAINIYSLHLNKDIWGDDVEEFKPDRFLPENVAKRHPYSFIPFSGGARNCIGN